MKLDGDVNVDRVWVDIVDAAVFGLHAPMAVGGGSSTANDYTSGRVMRNAEIRPQSSCGVLASILAKKASGVGGIKRGEEFVIR
jgi:hypothetical protein